MSEVVRVEEIYKSFKKNQEEVKALFNINLSFETGKMYAIIGPNGSGKSTLLKIIGTISKPDNGKVTICNQDISNLNSNELSNIRANKIGFIFQDFKLDNYLTAIENVMLPMLIEKKLDKQQRVDKAKELLDLVGLNNRDNHFPKELSQGEQQRVAIARSLANDPQIILADEPTGNIDADSEILIFELLKEISKQGKCVIVISHSSEIKNYADKIIHISKGIIKGD